MLEQFRRFTITQIFIYFEFYEGVHGLPNIFLSVMIFLDILSYVLIFVSAVFQLSSTYSSKIVLSLCLLSIATAIGFNTMLVFDEDRRTDLAEQILFSKLLLVGFLVFSMVQMKISKISI